MQLETFRGPNMRSAIALVEHTLGYDAMIVSSGVVHGEDGDVFEVVAAAPGVLDAFRRRLVDPPLSASLRSHRRGRPYVIALVGPPGAGKTTATMKIALHPEGLGGRRIGLVSLDTYRVGAVEEIQTYAELAGLPLEIVYHAREVGPALERLADVDVVLVDTPGRAAQRPGWLTSLEALQADEVHLVLPASLRHRVALGHRDRLELARVSHVLFTKLDELEDGSGLPNMVDAVDLPVRWVGDGYQVPGTLSPAASALGLDGGHRPGPALRERAMSHAEELDAGTSSGRRAAPPSFVRYG